jgi:integrase/recombinase XerD
MHDFYIHLDDFTSTCKAKGLSTKTIRSYEQTLTLFILYLEREKGLNKIVDVSEKHIRDYILYLQQRGKYTVVSNNFTAKFNNPSARNDHNKQISLTTINNYIRNIKVYFNWLSENRIIKKDIVKNIRQIKVDRKPKEFINDREFKQLLINIDISKYPEFRDYIIIQLLLDSGMRIGECLSLLEDDLDLKRKVILLRAENTKGKKTRYVYYSPVMEKYLKRWLQYKDRYLDSEYLFPTIRGTVLDVRNFDKNLKKYGQRIGINITPHQIRNNFAKRFLLNGGNIFALSKILGHSSVEVTERAYLDLDDEDIRKAYINFSPLSNLK